MTDHPRPAVDEGVDDPLGLGGAPYVDVDRAAPDVAGIAARHADDRAGAAAALFAGPVTWRAERIERLAEVPHGHHPGADEIRRLLMHVQVDEAGEDGRVAEGNPMCGLAAEVGESADPDNAAAADQDGGVAD